MTTFLPQSVNFMFKRLGPCSGDAMRYSSWKLSKKKRAAISDLRQPSSPHARYDMAKSYVLHSRAFSDSGLVNFEQSGWGNQRILNN
jgi:hypothetical protein